MRTTLVIIFSLSLLAFGCSGSSGKADVATDASDLSGNQPTDLRSTDGPLADTGLSVPDGSASGDLIDQDYTPGDVVDVTCCQTDQECPGNLQCVLPADGGEGQCAKKADHFLCYRDADCLSGYVCDSPHVCGCGEQCAVEICEPGAEDLCPAPACDEEVGCVTKAGQCIPMATACCTDDAGCPDGTRCVNLHNEAQGTCLPLATTAEAGRCWEDSDCQVNQECYNAGQCPCNAECDAPANRFGTCKMAGFRECVSQHTGCGCEPGCVDGFGQVVYYPAYEGEFPSDINPPQELLAVAKAMYTCSVCSCEEKWFLAGGTGSLAEVDGVEPFCDFMVSYAWECKDFCDSVIEPDDDVIESQDVQECQDPCLIAWQGGCC